MIGQVALHQIKYSPKWLVGTPASGSTTYLYTFRTTLSGTTDGPSTATIQLIPKSFMSRLREPRIGQARSSAGGRPNGLPRVCVHPATASIATWSCRRYGIEALTAERVALAVAQWASSDDSIDGLVDPVVVLP